MKTKGFVAALALLLLCALCLSACGETTPAETAPQAEPTPTPVPELSLGALTVPVDAETLDLSGQELPPEELIARKDDFGALRTIDLGLTSYSMDQLAAIQEAYPQAKLRWQVELLGRHCDQDTVALDLSDMSADQLDEALEAIARLPALQTINLIPRETLTVLSLDELARVAEAAPQAALDVCFSLFGQVVTSSTEELRYYDTPIGDEGVDEFRAVLPYLRSLKLLRLRECGITDNDKMAALREDFPEINVVWSIRIAGYCFMTDTTLINCPLLRDHHVELLQYMPDVEYVDIGHNAYLSSIDFIRYFPKLSVLIVSITQISDISAVADCPELEFFECITTPISDLSPLSGLTKLEYLNIGNMWNLRDISPIYGLTTLKMVRICMATFDHVSWKQVEQLQESLPECFVSTYGGDPTTSGYWRFDQDHNYTERYALLREQMRYDEPYWWMRMSNSASALEGEEFW